MQPEICLKRHNAIKMRSKTVQQRHNEYHANVARNMSAEPHWWAEAASLWASVWQGHLPSTDATQYPPLCLPLFNGMWDLLNLQTRLGIGIASYNDRAHGCPLALVSR